MYPLIQINIGSCSDGLINLCQRAPYARKQGGGLIPEVRNLERRSPLVPILGDGGYRAAVFVRAGMTKRLDSDLGEPTSEDGGRDD